MDLMKLVKGWWAYLEFCWQAPMQAPACRPFWTWVMIAAIAIGAIVLLRIVWKVISYKLKYAAALRAEAARQAVDVGAIDARRWDGDKAYSAELGGEEVERRIREAVDKRRQDNLTIKDKLNIV